MKILMSWSVEILNYSRTKTLFEYHSLLVRSYFPNVEINFYYPDVGNPYSSFMEKNFDYFIGVIDMRCFHYDATFLYVAGNIAPDPYYSDISDRVIMVDVR